MRTAAEYPSHVPLSALSLDERVNVRKTNRGADPEFVASILAKGVIVPLTVRPNGEGFKVTDGGKRLAALQALLSDGRIGGDYPVPIVVREEDDTAARDTSLTLAVVRSELHPVDEFEAFAELVKAGKTPEDIATEYALTTREVERVLALGRLSPKILEAWRAGRIGADIARAFTLAPDHKTQDRVFDKLAAAADKRSWRRGQIEVHEVKSELKANHQDGGRFVHFVGVEAYEARGGKVTRDLFGTDHVVSDPKLAKAIAAEKLEAECAKLVEAGWGWAVPADSVRERWSYGQVALVRKPSREEKEKMARLQSVIDEGGEEASAAAEAELARINGEIEARSFTADQKAKSGCFVEIDRTGSLKIEYGRVKPEEKRKVDAQERATERKKKAKSAEQKGDSGGTISNALMQRLSEALTWAAADVLQRHPDVAISAILAGAASEDKAVSITERGLKRKKEGYSVGAKRAAAFAGVFKGMVEAGKAGQMKALAELAAAALDFQVFHADHAPLKHPAVAAICTALDGADLNKALRSRFDARDYFGSASAKLATKALAEMGITPPKTGGKQALVKAAVAHAKTAGWLPPELRTAHYDGPGATAPAKAAAKAKRKAAAQPRRKAA